MSYITIEEEIDEVISNRQKKLNESTRSNDLLNKLEIEQDFESDIIEKESIETSDEEIAYKKSILNKDIFSCQQLKMKDLFRSTKYFFTKEYLKDDYTFLDVGGAGGLIPNAIKNEVADIKPTIIDPDPDSIEMGKNNVPDFEFICGYFPDDLNTSKKFDIVSMQALFPQIPNWKEMLLSLRKHAKKYINISLIFKLHGTTIIDKDTSYVYYLDSGERVHQVVHNINEFMNFCCIYEMGVKKIEFYGYHTKEIGHNFRCVPNSEQIKGNIMLELFENEEDNPRRFGGACETKNLKEYSFFIPEMNIIIDDEKYDPINI